ncbi:hypothetical protein [Bacteroides sp.]|uniref:hypothetical protein n=1 Tax=Bacteroides sp. TaxID=29523 RepID=UPI0025C722DD|nr:hypothetical protein [Bacteroides sp.]
MKNYLFLTMAVVAMMFFSCKDDDEKDALSGTTWVCNEEVSGFDECSRTILFHTNGECSVEVIEKLYGEDGSRSTASGTYKYVSPSISITWSDGYKENGTIEGAKMTLVDEDGYSEIFVKQ